MLVRGLFYRGDLTRFVRAHTLGRVLQEMIFDLRPHVDRERRPDVAFVSFSDGLATAGSRGHVPGP